MALPNTAMLALQEWLTQTQSWLLADRTSTAIRAPHEQLLRRMRDAMNERRVNRVWELLDEMKDLSLRRGDTREQGEIHIELARIAVDLENLKEALSLIQVAENKYKSYPHQRAVVLWMAGCIHWSLGNRVDAITSWEEAIALFEERELSVQVDSDKVAWYQDRLKDMRFWLENAIETERLPPLRNVSFEPTDSADAEQDLLRWLSCPVNDVVPAGGFGPVGFDPSISGYLEIREVVIEGEPYQVFNVQRETGTRNAYVSINFNERYNTVRVTGNSMNRATPISIEDGDYVFVQVSRVARDNSIVIAQIVGLDDRATIKRLNRRNGRIILRPESSDTYSPIDVEREFDRFDNGFSVYGVVRAVFKKR